MKVSVYQIDDMIIGEKALRAKMLRHVSYTSAVKLSGGSIDPGIYINVFTGEINCSRIEEAMQQIRKKQVTGFRGRDIEISDIIEMEGKCYFVDIHDFVPIPNFSTDQVGIHFTANPVLKEEAAVNVGRCPICKAVPAIQDIKLQGYTYNGFLRYEVSCSCGMRVSFPGCDTVNNKAHARERCIELWNVMAGAGA